MTKGVAKRERNRTKARISAAGTEQVSSKPARGINKARQVARRKMPEG